MREPYQVLVIPYKIINDDIKFAIFSRSDMKCWQWIAGGGEDFDESIIESARREAYEEARIPLNSALIELDSRTTIPVEHCAGGFIWGDDVYVVEEYSFGVNVISDKLEISSEHKGFKWVSYDEAMELLKYDSNRSALWELNIRLLRQTN
ncbi:NUDIX hydrolase [Oceanirhabdus seepicola]|uniref:NUDIX domain-containing protein n=1 Tax=Oceanirhabdus seepicola TaxID=2828781 RepID=A0A9J6P3R5_9CLOT|nr:NUDIX domain-containing protein [Oceanirhabdus seepicola]MCM1991195.1 NUDIX domain-containing protein [Oceanirhabdus seepicola]